MIFCHHNSLYLNCFGDTICIWPPQLNQPSSTTCPIVDQQMEKLVVEVQTKSVITEMQYLS